MNRPAVSSNSDGFTLVELMIAMVVTGIIVAAVYSAYSVNQKTYSAQQQVVQMQQNIRAAFQTIGRDIRMAGYKPEGGGAAAGFKTAIASSVRFTMDLNEDGDVLDTDEDVTYALYSSDGMQKLGRKDNNDTAPAAFQGIAESFKGLEFYYTLADGSQTLTPGNLANIRSVTVSLLAQAEAQDLEYTDTKTFTSASGATWGPYNDHLRRRLLITTVQCRNMGL